MPVNKYTKNPITIRALQFTNNYQELIDFVNNPDVLWVEDGVPYIKTLEGELKVSCFDYVIEGIHGEFYPCKPEIFEASYTEAVKLPEVPEHVTEEHKSLYLLKMLLEDEALKLHKLISGGYPGVNEERKSFIDEYYEYLGKLHGAIINRLIFER